MPSFNEQEKIINTFKDNFYNIMKNNFNYQDSVYKFNTLLNESADLIDNNFSEKLTIYFLKKMDNFITIQKLITEEILKLEQNLKQLDINYIIYINKLVNNLKDYSVSQRNIYNQIENKQTIKLLDELLVKYYNTNKEIFKSIKQIHKNGYNIINNNSKSNDNLILNINNNNYKNNNNIKIYNSQEIIYDKNINSKNKIINLTPKFKFILNNYIKSKSKKKLKNKLCKHSKSKGFLLDNNNPLFNDKIENFIKKKLQNKNSSSPCLNKRNYSFINSKINMETETTMEDSTNNLDISFLSNKIIDFYNNIKKFYDICIQKDKYVINKIDDINTLKINLEKKKNELDNFINNIKNKEMQNIANNNNLLNEINNLKEKNSELNKKILDLINENKIQSNKEINILYQNYSKYYEIFKLLNDNEMNNNLNQEEYILDKNIITEKKIGSEKIGEYIYNIYEKILELIEIKKNTFKEYKVNNIDYNSNNQMILNDNNNNYVKAIIIKVNNINKCLTDNENENKINQNNKNNNNNDIINIVTENKNLLSLSDELESPKSHHSNNNLENNINIDIPQSNLEEEDYNNIFKKIIDILDNIEKLIKEKKEEFNKINNEYLLYKNITQKLDTNLIDNIDNNMNYSSGISFRNNNK